MMTERRSSRCIRSSNAPLTDARPARTVQRKVGPGDGERISVTEKDTFKKCLLTDLKAVLVHITNAERSLRENRLLHCDNNIRAARSGVVELMNILKPNAPLTTRAASARMVERNVGRTGGNA